MSPKAWVPGRNTWVPEPVEGPDTWPPEPAEERKTWVPEPVEGHDRRFDKLSDPLGGLSDPLGGVSDPSDEPSDPVEELSDPSDRLSDPTTHAPVPIALTEPVGPDGAPLVVLGPSLGTSTILWEAVVPALAQTHRVLAWDLPGHGAAASASAAFTVADLADALAAALIDLGAETIAYAGVSLGGAVGLELLLRHPSLVDRAAILCSGAAIGSPDGWHDRAAQVRAQSTSSLIVGSAQRWFAPGSIAAHPELTGRLLHVLQNADDESYALCCEALAGYDVRDRLGEIAAPVLAVWGAHDQVTPEVSAREIADGVRDGSAAGIADASHLAPVDDPAAVAALLTDFLTDGTPS